MSNYECPECGDKWNGAFNCDLRCVKCGAAIIDMSEPVVKFMAVGDHDLDPPAPSREGDVGYDLRAASSVTLWPGEEALVGTGWAMQPPPGWAALILPRSGLGAEGGVVLGNLVGLIDPNYRGELKVKLWYRRQEGKATTINRGDRIAQMLLVPAMVAKSVEVSSLTMTNRGEEGFGSSGRA